MRRSGWAWWLWLVVGIALECRRDGPTLSRFVWRLPKWLTAALLAILAEHMLEDHPDA